MILLSIIVATYNSGKTLRRALESIHTQSFQDWECIVVDGASKDNTLQIVEEFEKKDSRFRHVSEPDTGIYDAFNKGWKIAKGEWIHYLGSDDRLLEDGFARLFSQELNAYLVGGGVYLIRNGEKEKLQFTHGIGGCHQGFITKRTALEQLGGFDEAYKIFADKDFLIRLEKTGLKIKNYEIPISYFYVGGISQSFKSLMAITKERYRSYKRTKYVRNPFGACVFIYLKYVLIHLKHAIIH